MTDRELLELAAKAAGIKLSWHEPTGYAWIAGPCVWNPLLDDGDAFRLGVDLGIFNDPRVWHYAGVATFFGSDKRKALRFALTKVAAKIGEQMP